MITIEAADAHIGSYCIDVDDWTDSDAAKKQRLLNVAQRTLSTSYPSYTIPDDAVYHFANDLAAAWNDTNRNARMGVKTINLDGVASFTFESGALGADDLSQFITKAVRDLINADPANAELPKIASSRNARRVRAVTM